MVTFIFAQIFGIFGMLANCLSFQQKTERATIFYQMLAGAMFLVNFLLLGAFVGMMLNLLSVVRALVFIYRDKTRANHPIWMLIFIASYIACYVLSFAVFKTPATPKNLIVEALPVIAMTVVTVSFRMRSAKKIRMFGLVNSPLWLTYDVFNFTIGGIIGETINIISIIIGIFRYDTKSEVK